MAQCTSLSYIMGRRSGRRCHSENIYGDKHKKQGSSDIWSDISRILQDRSRLLYTPPTASVYWSKEHGYHKCTRIGHSRILILITFGFRAPLARFEWILDAARHSQLNANNAASLLAKILLNPCRRHIKSNM